MLWDEKTRKDAEGAIAREDVHPLSIGACALVLYPDTRKLEAIEGIAIIRRYAEGAHRYWVEFIGDPVLRERFVHPNQQSRPVCVQLMLPFREFYLRDDDLSFSDFFPDNFPD